MKYGFCRSKVWQPERGQQATEYHLHLWKTPCCCRGIVAHYVHYSVHVPVFVIIQMRRSKLQESIRLFALLRECDEVESWIREKVLERILASGTGTGLRLTSQCLFRRQSWRQRRKDPWKRRWTPCRRNMMWAVTVGVLNWELHLPSMHSFYESSFNMEMEAVMEGQEPWPSNQTKPCLA